MYHIPKHHYIYNFFYNHKSLNESINSSSEIMEINDQNEGGNIILTNNNKNSWLTLASLT